MLPNIIKNKKSISEFFSKFVIITPEDAIRLLEYNTSNRPVREARIARYARAMKMGRWLPSNDAISFSTEGRLLNGQHRLQAIIRANTPVTILVASGLDEKAFDVIDRGCTRSPGDLAAAEGFVNPNMAVSGARAAIGILWAWNGLSIDFNKNKFLDADELLDWMNTYADDLQASVDIIGSLPKLRRGILVGLHFAIGSSNHSWFEDVLKRASDGFPIQGQQDAAFHIRQMFIEKKLKNPSNDDYFKLIKVASTGLSNKMPKLLKRGSQEEIPPPPKDWRKDAVYNNIPSHFKFIDE